MVAKSSAPARSRRQTPPLVKRVLQTTDSRSRQGLSDAIVQVAFFHRMGEMPNDDYRARFGVLADGIAMDIQRQIRRARPVSRFIRAGLLHALDAIDAMEGHQ
jgi:hypothetical protein